MKTRQRLRIRPSEMARLVASGLLAKDLKLVVAESCTGGLIAEWLTRIPGSSRWFERGLITYSNAAKKEMLGVQAATLEQYGAVSEEIAAAMALGAIEISGADLAVAVTGIAGPNGGTKSKPVGTVCLAWADRSGVVDSARVQLDGNRQSIRRQTAALALEGVRDRAAAL